MRLGGGIEGIVAFATLLRVVAGARGGGTETVSVVGTDDLGGRSGKKGGIQCSL